MILKLTPRRGLPLHHPRIGMNLSAAARQACCGTPPDESAAQYWPKGRTLDSQRAVEDPSGPQPATDLGKAKMLPGLDRQNRKIASRQRDFAATLCARLCQVIAIAAVLAGCSAPNPNTPAGEAEIAGQQCTICIRENPGDDAPCRAICMQRVEDQGAYLKAYGHQ